jgi:acetyltransferase-like isoleucine patch superfamily enzyme
MKSISEIILSRIWVCFIWVSKVCKIGKSFHFKSKITKLVNDCEFSFEIGQDCNLASDLIINIEPGCHLLIGNDVVIWERSILQAKGNSILQIGSGTRVGRDCNICARKKVIIGSNVLFSSYIWVTDHQHKFDLETPVKVYEYQKFQDIIIGDGTFVGNKVTIMQGVTIGKNCVIGANSVVTNDIPDGCVAAGVPAKVINKG